MTEFKLAQISSIRVWEIKLMIVLVIFNIYLAIMSYHPKARYLSLSIKISFCPPLTDSAATDQVHSLCVRHIQNNTAFAVIVLLYISFIIYKFCIIL